MNKPDKQHAPRDSAKTAAQAQQWDTGDHAPTFFRAPNFARIQPTLSDGQVVHEITDDDVIKATPAKSAVNSPLRAARDDDVWSRASGRLKSEANPPLRAAKGDDDLMSQQGNVMRSPDEGGPKGQWRAQVDAAKIAWDRLTEDELLRLQGDQQKLTTLVQERYGISRQQADRQVKVFFDFNDYMLNDYMKEAMEPTVPRKPH